MGNLELKFKIENLMDGSSVAIVQMKGSIDGTTVKKFEAETMALAQKGFKYLILDFHEIGYMNSTGLGILVKVLDKYQEKNGDMKLVQVPKKVLDLFDMLGISSILSIYHSMQESLNSLPSKVVAKAEIPESPVVSAAGPTVSPISSGPSTGKGKAIVAPPAPQPPLRLHTAVSAPPPLVSAGKPKPQPVVPAPSDDDMGGIVIDAEELSDDGIASAQPRISSPAPAALPTRSLKRELPPQPEAAKISPAAEEEGAIEELDLSSQENANKAATSIESSIDLNFGQEIATDKNASDFDLTAMPDTSLTASGESLDRGIDLAFDKGQLPAAKPMSPKEIEELMGGIEDKSAGGDGEEVGGEIDMTFQDALAVGDTLAQDGTGVPECTEEPAKEEMEEITEENDQDNAGELLPDTNAIMETPLSELPGGTPASGTNREDTSVAGAGGEAMDIFSFDDKTPSQPQELSLDAAEDKMDIMEQDEIDAIKDMGSDLAEAGDEEKKEDEDLAGLAKDKEDEEDEDLAGLAKDKVEDDRKTSDSAAAITDAPKSSKPVTHERGKTGLVHYPVPSAVSAATTPTTPATPASTPGETLKRKSTVRYYSQMNPFKAYPLSVALSKESIKKVKLEQVAQTEGRKVIEVAREKTDVTIAPCLSGCLVSPSSITLDVTPETATAEFWVTPVIEGNISGWVDIVYQGKIVDKIVLTTRSVQQTIAKIGAAGAILSPVLSLVLDGLQWNMKGLGSMFSQMQGAIGLWLVGLVLMLLFVGTGVFFYLRNRPQEAEIVEKFFTMEQMKK
jgi:anti-sigma B factor antagonist